jgi:hypothetical protein
MSKFRASVTSKFAISVFASAEVTVKSKREMRKA